MRRDARRGSRRVAATAPRRSAVPRRLRHVPASPSDTWPSSTSAASRSRPAIASTSACCPRIEAALAAHPLPTVPCHNDLLAENYLDDGERLWLVDWEYSGNNDPTFELGNTAQELGYDDAQVAELCAAYFGEASPALLARMRLQMIMSDVGWTLWAAIQARISTIDYDFTGWAEERWARADARSTAPNSRAGWTRSRCRRRQLRTEGEPDSAAPSTCPTGRRSARSCWCRAPAPTATATTTRYFPPIRDGRWRRASRSCFDKRGVGRIGGRLARHRGPVRQARDVSAGWRTCNHAVAATFGVRARGRLGRLDVAADEGDRPPCPPTRTGGHLGLQGRYATAARPRGEWRLPARSTPGSCGLATGISLDLSGGGWTRSSRPHIDAVWPTAHRRPGGRIPSSAGRVAGPRSRALDRIRRQPDPVVIGACRISVAKSSERDALSLRGAAWSRVRPGRATWVAVLRWWSIGQTTR